MIRTRVGYHNVKVDLPDRSAQRALRLMLAEDPDILGLGEWGPNRNHILRAHGKLVVGDKKHTSVHGLNVEHGMIWLRPPNGPVTGLAADRYRPYSVKGILLAEGRDVRDQPGTSGREPDNWATAVRAVDTALDREVAIFNFHFNAHVQGTKGYRYPDDPRAAMHQEERAMAEEWFAEELRTGSIPYMLGDTNWHRLDLPPAVATHVKREVGTKGNRDIDSIYARRAPRDTYEIVTPSDHDGRMATYG